MGDAAVREGLEPSIDNPVEDGCKVVSAGEEIKSAIPKTVDTSHQAQSKIKLTDEVTEKCNNEGEDPAKKPTIEEKIDTRDANGVSSNAEIASAKARDAKNWNDRNLQRKEYKKNVKSDFTSQEMSDDPTAIRRQVNSPTRTLPITCANALTFLRNRLNFTFPTPTCLLTGFFSPRLRVTRISQFL